MNCITTKIKTSITVLLGQEMRNIGSYKKKTKNGFEQEIYRYQAQNFHGCPLRGLCHKFKYNRIIERNYHIIRLK